MVIGRLLWDLDVDKLRDTVLADRLPIDRVQIAGVLAKHQDQSQRDSGLASGH